MQNSNETISLNLDKIIKKFNNIFIILPFLLSIIVKQNYYLKELKIITKQEKDDIKNGIAFFDIHQKKVLYFDDEKNPTIRFEQQKQARRDKINHNIVVFILSEIKSITLDEDVIRKNSIYLEEEFLPFWEKYSYDMSREDLQKIWAQILIAELKNPHTISTRTMNFIRTIKHKEARMLELISPYVLDQRAVLPMHNVLHNIDFSYLQSIGLLIDHVFIDCSENTHPTIDNRLVMLPNQEIYISIWLLTDIAQELYKLSPPRTFDLTLIEEIFDTQKNIPIDTKISFHNILQENPTDHNISYNQLPIHIYHKRQQIDFDYQKYNLPRISQEQ